MRLLICGSRHWTATAPIAQELLLVWPHEFGPEDVMIHGAAPGADSLAERVACELYQRAEVRRFPADWQRDGRAAGPVRNARMLVEGRPERGLAFGTLWRPLFAPRRGPGGVIRDEQTGWKLTGTGDMVKRLLAARLPVRWVATAEAEAVELVEMPAPPATTGAER